jgi:hypothetical protein
MTRGVSLGLIVLAGGVLAQFAAYGEDGCCAGCGRVGACHRVCRLICETKEISKTTYCCACEDICVPGPSVRCTSDCNCGHCAECRHHGWIPTAGQIRTRKMPVKQVEKITVPSYRFIVEYLCPHCLQQSK